MKKITGFNPSDRYRYDEMLLQKGFSQVDTWQDAPYFGTWANPETLTIFSYCEGDTTKTICEIVEEFKSEMERIKEFYKEDNSFGVDSGFDTKRADLWRKIGLSHMLH